jgi:hypothetical protein
VVKTSVSVRVFGKISRLTIQQDLYTRLIQIIKTSFFFGCCVKEWINLVGALHVSERAEIPAESDWDLGDFSPHQIQTVTFCKGVAIGRTGQNIPLVGLQLYTAVERDS